MTSIIVTWNPPDALSNIFYNVPLGEQRTAQLRVERRLMSSEEIKVRVKGTLPSWLTIWPMAFTVPTVLIVTVDTTNIDVLDGKDFATYFYDLEFVKDE